ncbi:MAG: UDP-N-acetylmuramate dehydrogenase [Candidatus Staskawiczbacteria bacterium]|nr:UDP-N-acetylmuramate dehydrogenase [Candidatus Staskawiczbacteria bacterium]
MVNKISEHLKGVQKNVLLKNFTSYKIGGPAKYFFIAKTKENLIKALEVAKKFNLPVFILGGGSNLLISDKGFLGLVIKMSIAGIKFEGKKAFVGAGANLTKTAYASAKNGLSGLEWAAGIPQATVGGAIYGHAQAFGDRMSNVVKSVEAINLKTLKVAEFSKEQCKFSLKSSIFKKSASRRKKWVIVSAVLEFETKKPAKIKSKIKENLKYRKRRHPINFPSAGSSFVNPETKIKNKNLLIKFPELAEYNKRGVMPAGYLITKCGLAGKKIGKAQISQMHSNFIINLGGAKAKDVLKLLTMAKSKVRAKFGISLEEEVQIL